MYRCGNEERYEERAFGNLSEGVRYVDTLGERPRVLREELLPRNVGLEVKWRFFHYVPGWWR